MPSIVGTLMNGVCTRVPSPAPAVQPVPHERVVVGVELQAAELTAAGSGLAAEQRRMETERVRAKLLAASLGRYSIIEYGQ